MIRGSLWVYRPQVARRHDTPTRRAASSGNASSFTVRGQVSVAKTLSGDPYGLPPDELRTIAVGCWQRRDAEVNAALYEHQGTFRAAVLEAACIAGAGKAFERGGYRRTGTWQDWAVHQTYDEADAYVRSVEDRFGSIESFVAISQDELQSEDARCSEMRDLISPKRSGTWRVGSEIRRGTWRAFDESDCYWARLREDGRILDNHFGDALRISVNVRSSDALFEVSGCTFFFEGP